MIIREFKYSPFSFHLKEPFQNSHNIFLDRQGFIISIQDEFGAIGIGECSPLPGSSKESYNDVEEILNKMKKDLIGFKLKTDLGINPNLLSGFNLLPSVSFGIEQAILSLLLTNNYKFFIDKSENVKKAIYVNSVIGLDTTENILANISRKIELGYRTFKIKVGRDNPYDDLVLLSTIRDKFGNEIKLRLDANGRWSADEAIEYLEHIMQFNIEFIEEPCEYISSSLRVAEELPVPIALDESLESYGNAVSIITESKIEHIVIKPMILCGLLSTINLIHEAEIHDKKVIISSSFETAVGKSGLVFLASLIKNDMAHGLDTSDYFENNLFTDQYPVMNGNISFSTNSYPPNFKIESI
jgi:L-Ala-D/L-Glu epimerase